MKKSHEGRSGKEELGKQREKERRRRKMVKEQGSSSRKE